MAADFLLIGGDARQTHLAALLSANFSVQTLTVPNREDTPAPDAPRIVLPIPTLTPEGKLRAPADEALDRLLRSGSILYGGALGDYPLRCKPEGVQWIDLLADETAVVENAQLTADAALLLTMQQTQRSLHGLRCCVIGWGRIGRLLCPRLAACGAEVCVLSRQTEHRALARAFGYSSDLPSQVCNHAPDLIFNTAPAQTVPTEALLSLPAQTLWIELASAPGGLPKRPALGFAQLAAGGLPGKLLPVSAAAVLYRAILRTM